jgi:hypothetical protein
MTDMENTLNTTQGNLIMIAAQVRIISRNISDLNDSLYEIKLIIGQYQDVITDAQGKLDSIQRNIATIITVTAWIFTIIFIWLGIAQFGLLTQGLERINWRTSQENESEPDPQLSNESVELEDKEIKDDPQMNDEDAL